MGAVIPKKVKEADVTRYLAEMGFLRTYQGKTRDMYDLGDYLLIVASDRLSIFDFVLPVLVPKKGEVLTALTHFWLTSVLSDFPNHLLPSENDADLNAVHDLKERYPELPLQRCLVVKKVNILDDEMILRHHIGGSVYKNYLATGMAGGHKLTPDLPKWSKLDKPIFTPSTKAEIGHDVNYDAVAFFNKHGKNGHKIVNMLMAAYMTAYAFAEKRGILILDTKFEGDYTMLADEVLTPDSSRFCDAEDWTRAMKEGREPQFKDKEPVRIFGKKIVTPFENNDGSIVGINKLEPTDPKHLSWIAALTFPDDIIRITTRRYLEILQRLTKKDLPEYQKEDMKIVA